MLTAVGLGSDAAGQDPTAGAWPSCRQTKARLQFAGMVLGLGVNLNLPEEMLAIVGQPATSLAAATGVTVDVAAFRDAVLQDFFSCYDEFLLAGTCSSGCTSSARARNSGEAVGSVAAGSSSIQ